MRKEKQSKYEKVLGKSTVEEIESQSVDGLKNVVVEANKAMQQVKLELEENPNYQTVKAQVKDLESGKKDVDKRQKAKISLALKLLAERG